MNSVEEYEMIPKIADKYQNPTPQMNQIISNIEKRSPGRPRKNTLSSSHDKLFSSLIIALKLASSNAYDEKRHLKRLDGTIIDGSDIIQLITNALSPGKNLLGQEEFVKWLKKVDIDPSIIINENIRQRLIYRQQKNTLYTTVSPLEKKSQEMQIDETADISKPINNTEIEADVNIPQKESSKLEEIAQIAQNTPLPAEDIDIDEQEISDQEEPTIEDQKKNIFRNQTKRTKQSFKNNNTGLTDKKRKFSWDNNGND